MPSLQSFAATFSNIFGGGQPDVTTGGGVGAVADNKNSGANQFASLLDVVGNIGDDNKAQPIRKDEVRDPVAAAVDAPAQFRDNIKQDTVQDANNNNDDNRQDDKSARVDGTSNGRKYDDKKIDKPVSKNADKTTGNKDDSGQDTKISASNRDKAENDNEVAANEEDASGIDKLKEKIAAKIDSLSDLLNIISKLLAGLNGGIGQVDASFVQSSQVSVTLSADNTGVAVLGDSQKSDPLAVLANIKDALAKLEQFLQSAGGQDLSQLTQEQDAILTNINNALQADLDALKNLFPQAAGGDDAQSIFNQLLQAQQADKPQNIVASDIDKANPAQDSDAKSLLHDDIAQIKEALFKFRSDRLSDVHKIDTSNQNLQARPVLDNSADNLDLNPVKTDIGKADPVIFSGMAANSVGEQNQASQAAQPQNNNAPVVAAAALDASSNKFSGNVDADAGGNSGQGGNAGSQFSFTSASGTQLRPASSAASHTNFSNFLNRASDTPVSEQVLFHVKTAVGKGDSRITIQLNPEELGKLDITLDVDSKGKAGISITADNKQTLDLLQRDSQGLQKALSEAGLKADSGSLSFNLRGGEREGQGQNGSQAANSYKKSQPDELLPEEMNVASLAVVSRSYVINLPDGLDIKI